MSLPALLLLLLLLPLLLLMVIHDDDSTCISRARTCVQVLVCLCGKVSFSVF